MDSLQKFTPKFFLTAAFIGIVMLFSAQSYLAQKNGTPPAAGNIENQAFDQYNGTPFKQCWSFPFENSNVTNIASDNEKGVYLSFENGDLLKINSDSGKISWKTNLGSAVISGLLVTERSLYISAQYSTFDQKESKNESFSVIRSLDKNTGLTLQGIKLPAASEKVYLFEYADTILFVAQEGLIYRLQMSERRILWEKKLGSTLSAVPFLAIDFLILGTADNSIIKFLPATGESAYKITVSASPTIIVSGSGSGKFFWGDQNGSVTAIYDLSGKSASIQNTGKIRWKFRHGAEISHIVSTARGLLVSSHDNFVYLMAEKNGDLIWKRRFTGRISFQPLVVGNYAFIATDAESEALIIEVNSGKLVNKIPIGSDNIFIENPLKIEDKFIFPTLNGLLSFSTICAKSTE